MQCFSAGIRIIGDFLGQVCSLSNVSPRSGSFGLLTSTSDLGRRSWADTNSDGHAGRQLVDAGSGNVKYAVAPVLHQQSTQAMAKMVHRFLLRVASAVGGAVCREWRRAWQLQARADRPEQRVVWLRRVRRSGEELGSVGARGL